MTERHIAGEAFSVRRRREAEAVRGAIRAIQISVFVNIYRETSLLKRFIVITDISRYDSSCRGIERKRLKYEWKFARRRHATGTLGQCPVLNYLLSEYAFVINF
ncbi:hypothetical protein HW532_18680 [Kaustia mangrovi]|uniref:Uncharacterized protein n=1 Tax=Kaustia mangrovi TaxID=2593653 RepID=A0A7S8C0T7_9HYPH|nr:hypothetical protein [Kaustia mangrovi]QPC41268.1 hypothetical protein HW532_18680 [Kaustia mangrovi]